MNKHKQKRKRTEKSTERERAKKEETTKEETTPPQKPTDIHTHTKFIFQDISSCPPPPSLSPQKCMEWRGELFLLLLL